MIPNIRNGASFKHAGLYYLHDKAARDDNGQRVGEHPTTTQRVGWTATLNCANDDPELALKEMMATFYDQDRLKAEAGVRAGGRRLENPVKTVSLSWHPSQTPERAEMETAARSYLEKMGWQEHQAVLIAHTDTAHPHLHLIINRIHPETGRTLADWQDWRRSQAWAHEWEKEHGRVFCETRAKIYESGERTDARGLPHDAAFLIAKAEATARDEDIRRAAADGPPMSLKDRQKEERIAFFEEGRALFRQARQEVYREVRADLRPQWREHFAWAGERRDEARDADASAAQRVLTFLRDGDLAGAAVALIDRDALSKAAGLEIKEAAAELKGMQSRITRDLQDQAIDALRAEREVLYRELLDRQRDERALEKAGLPIPDPVSKPSPANDNRMQPEIAAPLPELPVFTRQPEAFTEQRLAEEAGQSLDIAALRVGRQPEDPTPPRRGLEDLAAAGIGSVAGYLGDQLAEFFAPTPPEERAARNKAIAKAEAEREDKPVAPNPYAAAATAASARIETEKEQERADRYWGDRDRERDR